MTGSSKAVLNAIAEMTDITYESLEAAKQDYSTEEILNFWLNYEGIYGYTSRILSIVNALK